MLLPDWGFIDCNVTLKSDVTLVTVTCKAADCWWACYINSHSGIQAASSVLVSMTTMAIGTTAFTVLAGVLHTLNTAVVLLLTDIVASHPMARLHPCHVTTSQLTNQLCKALKHNTHSYHFNMLIHPQGRDVIIHRHGRQGVNICMI